MRKADSTGHMPYGSGKNRMIDMDSRFAVARELGREKGWAWLQKGRHGHPRR